MYVPGHECIDIGVVTNAAIIQFMPNEGQGHHGPHNDVLVITTTLVNCEVSRIFIDLESLANILFVEPYNQMELGDVPLELVDTSLYGFAGKVVWRRGQISLPLSLGTEPCKRT